MVHRKGLAIVTGVAALSLAGLGCEEKKPAAPAPKAPPAPKAATGATGTPPATGAAPSTGSAPGTGK
jgi:hypothetical protein